MTRHSYARISDSLLDIFNATEIGTATTQRDGDLSTSSRPPFADLEWPETDTTDNATNDTDYLAEDDDPVEQQQFHRISGILSQLIREASNAINSTPLTIPTKLTTNENEDDKPLEPKSVQHTDGSADIMENILSTYTASASNDSTHATIYTDTFIDNAIPQQNCNNSDISLTTKDSRRRSRLPRPKKLSLESFAQHYHDHQYQHDLQRNRAFSNASSTISSTTSTPNLDEDDTLFSPVPSNLTTPMSRTISPLFLEKESHSQQQQYHTNNNGDFVMQANRAKDQNHNKAKHGSQLRQSDFSLTDSFERLDSSLAKVDTLSRDLANYRRKHPRSSNLLHTSGAEATQVPPPASTFISSDNNIAANQHHRSRKKGHSDGWAVLLMMLPLFYIPYLLTMALWEKWNLAATVATTTPLDFLSTTIMELVFGVDSKMPRTLLSSSTATQIVPLSVGLSVYTLFMMVLRLLIASKPSSGTLGK